MRRVAIALVVVASARLAGADATVPPEPGLTRCTMMDGPVRRAWASKLDEKARAAAGGGLALSSVGERHLLMSTWWHDKPPRALVLDKRSLRHVVGYEGSHIAGLVEAEDGSLVGVVAIAHSNAKAGDTELRLIPASSGAPARWTNTLMLGGADSLTTLVAGELVVVASFHRIATGARLFAFDLATGQRRWEADVVQLGVPHSKYWNDVALARDGTRVVMRGYEAGGCYEQTFDLATGRRLSSSVDKRW